MSTAAISVRINGPERYLFRGTGQSTTQASLSEHNHAASEQTGKPDPENESGGRESKEHKGTHSQNCSSAPWKSLGETFAAAFRAASLCRRKRGLGGSLVTRHSLSVRRDTNSEAAGSIASRSGGIRGAKAK